VHPKDWILERYLNIAYFGDGTYGVQSAARHYFGVNAKKLNLRQSAMLAGLVKNPTGYDPTNSPDRALARRNVVLDRMASLNVISREEAQKTKERKLGLKVVTAKNGCWFSRAPFFCDYAWNYLLDDPALGDTVAQRRQLLKSGGLTIRSTVDLDDQAAAEKAVKDHVDQRDQAVGALAMVEPRTGDVKAIAQSRPMGRSQKKGQTFLNYAVPTKYGDSAGFQAGSTFKPFVLAAAIEEGIPLRTTFNAPMTMTIDTGEFANCPNAGNFVGDWKVSSSTISGTMDLYVGTQKSVNTFYAMLERATGVCKPYKIARSLGVQLTYPKGDATHLPERVPTFTLGIADASPLEMAEAYATFAGRGLHCDSRPVTSIKDASGNVLKRYPKSCKQALPESTADAINDVLRGVQEPGGFGLSVPSAGKTGTTQDGKAVWFVGYTPQLATAAMIAGATKKGGKPMQLAGQTIHGNYIYSVTGSGFAGPMWADAMHAIQKRLDPIDFVEPNSDSVNGIPTTVPSTSGMSMDTAASTLSQAGFNPIRGGSTDSGNPIGTVARSEPGGGSTAPQGSVVTIYESNGHKPKQDKGKGKGKPGKGKPGRGGR
jgi:membrane peptidoglycan carboxypeptidase